MSLQRPCPYCGELQAYGEARPSKPRVIGTGEDRTTVYDTHCRACDARIVWACSFPLARRVEKAYSWERPT